MKEGTRELLRHFSANKLLTTPIVRKYLATEYRRMRVYYGAAEMRNTFRRMP